MYIGRYGENRDMISAEWSLVPRIRSKRLAQIGIVIIQKSYLALPTQDILE